MTIHDCTTAARRAGLLFLATACALGCAKATVKPGQVGGTFAIRKPSAAWVYPFAIQPSDITLNSGIFSRAARYVDESDATQEQMTIANQAQATMAKAVADGIQQLGIPAQVASYGGPQPPPGVLLVEGQFVRISEGNELRRVVIGFGVGSSRVITQVQAYETTPTRAAFEHTPTGEQLLLAFATDSHSGEFPGAVVGAAGGPIGGGVAAVRAAAEVTYDHVESSAIRDVELAAKQVVAYLSQYMGKQGWIAAGMVQKTNVSH